MSCIVQNENNPAYEMVKLDSNLPVSIRLFTRKSFRNCESHWHRSVEFEFFLEGEMNIYVNGKKNLCTAGSFCLINSEEVHRLEVQKDFEIKDGKVIGLILLIGYDFIRSLIPEISDIYFRVKDIETEIKIKNLLLKLLREQEMEDFEFNNVRMLGTICELLLVLCQNCRADKNIIRVNTQRDAERIRRILSYIHENYRENLIQYELAEKFHFSREYFSKFFKKYTGMNCKEYVTRYRLEKAERQMLETDKTILEIALENGFGDERQLIHSFKKYYGDTPSQYRKKKRL